jgi:hypothetical protein
MSTLYSFNLISAAIHKAVMSENNGAIILSEGENPIDVDIVFVHGLAENRISTWEKNGKVWPRDFLPDYLPNARIITVRENDIHIQVCQY